MRTPRIGIFPLCRKISKTQVGKSPKRLLCASEYLPDAWPAEALAKGARFNGRSQRSHFLKLSRFFSIVGERTQRRNQCALKSRTLLGIPSHICNKKHFAKISGLD